MGDVSNNGFGGLGAAVQGIAGLGSATASYLGTQDQIAAAQQNQAAANAFSAQQYATRYQTTVKDLQAAGLNPMLAYGQGAGSAPSSAAPAPTFNKYAGAAQELSTGTQKALAASNMALQNELTDAQVTESISRTGVNDEERKLKDAQTKLAILQSGKVPHEIKQLISQTLLNDANRSATGAYESASRLDQLIRRTGDLPEAINKGKFHRNTPVNPFGQKQFESGVNTAVNAVNAVKGTSALPYYRPGESSRTTHISPSGESSITLQDRSYGK